MHATCVAVNGMGALLVGRSGSGKSDLALRCIMQAPIIGGRQLSAGLVADDQVALDRRGSRIWGRAPDTLSGKLEVRGLGIIAVAPIPEAEIRVVIDLLDKDGIERLPDPSRTTQVLGLPLSVLEVAPFEASASLKVLLALAQAAR